MFRFTTLAMLLVLAFTTAVLTGCNSDSKGSQAKSPLAPPPAGSEGKAPTQEVPKPPGG